MTDIADIGFKVDTSGLEKGEKGLDDLAKAGEKTAKSIDHLENEAKQLGSGFVNVGQGAEGASRRLAATTSYSRNLGGAVQNTSYQLQDMIVQFQMGADASRVMGQQLPQLLGGFGPLGAILGVVAGGMAALIPIMISLGDDAESSAEKVLSLSNAIDNMDESVGKAELEVKKLIRGFHSLEEVVVTEKIEELQKKIEELRSSGDKNSLFGVIGLTGTVKEIEDLEIQLSKYKAARRELSRSNVDSSLQESKAIGDLFSQYQQGVLSLKEYNIQKKVYAEVTKLGVEADETAIKAIESRIRLEEALSDKEKAAVEAGKISTERSKYISSLESEIQYQRTLIQYGKERADAELAISEAREKGGSAAVQLQGELIALEKLGAEKIEQEKEDKRAAETKQQYIDKLQEELRYQRDLLNLGKERADAEKRLREAQAKGGDFAVQLQNETNALIGLNQEHEEAIKRNNELARDLGMTFSSAFEDAIVRGEDFSDVLKGIEQDIARIIIRQAVIKPLLGAISGVDFGSMFSNLFSFAGGGYTGSGPRSGGVDGKGGFPAIVHPNETVIDNTKQSSSAGGMVVHNQITIDARGADAGVEKKIRQAVMEATQRSYNAIAQDFSTNGALRRSLTG